MIDLTMEEWGKRLLKTGRYKNIRYNYAEKYTLVLDTKTGFKYEATYNMTTYMMNLNRVE
jgi:hypothetical protein